MKLEKGQPYACYNRSKKDIKRIRESAAVFAACFSVLVYLIFIEYRSSWLSKPNLLRVLINFESLCSAFF